MASIKPILASDAVHVKGKHLFKNDGTQFIIKGIAFPTPPETMLTEDHRGYHSEAWLKILHQLRDSELEFNAVRMYRMYPERVDYSEFFRGAAELGVYVIVPLTAASGPGVLDRKLAAPKCYKPKLFKYGARAIREYLRYPNVLAGVVGNEVMNDEKAWRSAPCIRAYARDLKVFMDSMVEEGAANRTLPLIYAAQDSATIGGAAVDKDTVMKLTVDYLTCSEEGKGVAVPDMAGKEPTHGIEHFSENKFGQSPIDIYGVNIESWCSSTQDFYKNPDGTPGSYYSLWQALRNSSIPIIFSEMGCPHSQFDRDDLERKTKEGTRDWAQIPVVLDDMGDSWSGFVAYTYDGPKDFIMFDGGEWNGKDVLTPTKDFENFKHQLKKISRYETNITLDEFDDGRFLPSRCDDVETDLLSCCGVRLFNDEKMPSYSHMIDVHTGREVNNNMWLTMAAFVLALGATFWIHKNSRAKRIGVEGVSLLNGNSIENVEYKSISS
ncbi:hypothetical protein HJC23_006000 [Cyclotella cryptica]|uniref:Glycoside hydrolase family 5 domain-containing protein n=1 Tax=Cyclotella cryptica TaxID=29204 RepID=A0ABD3NWI0_9STRA